MTFQLFRSSANVVEDSAYKKAIRKGRGRPKGVLNSTVIEIHSLPGSPMKLRSKNLAGSSFLSQHSDAISEREIPEVVEGQLISSDVNITVFNSKLNSFKIRDCSIKHIFSFTKHSNFGQGVSNSD